MNFLYLKYALEVAKTGSINKAAENLLMGQPNLSRSIKSLEDSIGIKIFERSPKGMIMTAEGQEFLSRAKDILDEIDKIENMYRGERIERQKFSISVPRVSYISRAFAMFLKRIDCDSAEVLYKEANAAGIVKDVLSGECKLGILRYKDNYEGYFREFMSEQGLEYKIISAFPRLLIMNKDCPLAKLPEIRISDLEQYTEIEDDDMRARSLYSEYLSNNNPEESRCRNIRVLGQASRFDALAENNMLYMWCSPMSEKLSERYGIVQKECSDSKKRYRDVLLCKKDYTLTDIDNVFMEEIFKIVHK